MSESENEPKQNLDKISKNGEEEGDLEKLSENLEELPPQIRKVVEATLSMERISSSSLVSPISEKINEQHIDKILNIVEKDDERAFADS